MAPGMIPPMKVICVPSGKMIFVLPPLEVAEATIAASAFDVERLE